NPVYALPSFLAIVGLTVFAHGVTYWGRLYLVGVFFFAASAAMPLVPVRFWPGMYGLLLGVMQLAVGFHLRRVHTQAKASHHIRNNSPSACPFADPFLSFARPDFPGGSLPPPETVRALLRCFRGVCAMTSTEPTRDIDSTIALIPTAPTVVACYSVYDYFFP